MDWLRFLAFAPVSLIVLGWALIEQFSDRAWNVLKVSIVLTGYTLFFYMSGLALNWSPLPITSSRGYFDLVRIFMAASIIGVPVVWRSVWWSFQDWLCRKGHHQFCRIRGNRHQARHG